MPDTGFVDQQWLVRRGDTYVQVTELLYTLLEQLDGERTVAQVAERLTDLTPWQVTPEHVQTLVRTRLAPLGLVGAASAAGTPLAAPEPRPRTPSLLRVNARIAVIGPGAVDRVARVAQWFFHPVFAVPLLALVLVAQVWVFAVHGIGAAVREVLFEPGMLVVVLGVLLLAGVVHEFGHASALRYGGGRARSMGFGLYLVYPALFTDTTEAYRLGRWARVRTDLGGFYFHLLFAAAMVYVHLVTGREWPLLVVLLIHLDIARQLVPFVRLDGYWALADLVGVPDFFTQMRPFLRQLRRERSEGQRLPALQRRAALVFALYVLLCVPALVVLLGVLLLRLPDLLALIRQSAARQVEALAGARESADALGALAAGSQLFLLAVETVGIGLFLALLLSPVLKQLTRAGRTRLPSDA